MHLFPFLHNFKKTYWYAHFRSRAINLPSYSTHLRLSIRDEVTYELAIWLFEHPQHPPSLSFVIKTNEGINGLKPESCQAGRRAASQELYSNVKKEPPLNMGKKVQMQLMSLENSHFKWQKRAGTNHSYLFFGLSNYQVTIWSIILPLEAGYRSIPTLES